LGKIMYQKIMNTDPDQTPRNVRVITKMNAVQLGKFAQRTLLDPNFEKNNPPPSASEGHRKHQRHLDVFDDEEEAVEEPVGRGTVKKLSRLILVDEHVKTRKIEIAKAKAEKALEW